MRCTLVALLPWRAAPPVWPPLCASRLHSRRARPDHFGPHTCGVQPPTTGHRGPSYCLPRRHNICTIVWQELAARKIALHRGRTLARHSGARRTATVQIHGRESKAKPKGRDD
eukprot:6788945-Prymnesium_polylepis.1